MRFHDFHLEGYSVSEGGRRIRLHLVLPPAESLLEFSNVAAYDFIHTGGAVITDLEEVPLAQLLGDVFPQLVIRCRDHGGFVFWNDDREAYERSLRARDFRAWKIGSAIGFAGYVIASDLLAVENGSPTSN